MIDIEDAARLGGSAGLMGEGSPADIASWPAAAQAAFAEQYARGRHCRRVAEGKAALASREPADVSRYAGASRAQLVAEYRSRPELQREFGDVSAFVAFALAEQQGRARVMRGRVVS